MSQPPERLRKMNPDIERFWNPTLSIGVNLGRFIRGEVHSSDEDEDYHDLQQETTQQDTTQQDTTQQDTTQQDTQPNRQEDHGEHRQQQRQEERVQEQGQQSNDHDIQQNESDPAKVSTNTEDSTRMPTPHPIRGPQQQTTAGVPRPDQEFRHSDRDQLVRALCRPAPHSLQRPLPALQQQLANLDQHGGPPRAWLLVSLFDAASKNSTTVQRPPHAEPAEDPWTASTIASATLGIFACPAQRLREVFEFGPEELNGLTTFEAIRQTPSESLRKAFLDAKARACGDKGSIGLITVSLVDGHMLELKEQGRPRSYTSFKHTFVLGVAPEGVIVWQAWGDVDDCGYAIGHWVSSGGSRIRNWQEAGDFVDTFEKFASYEVSGLLILSI